MKCFLKSLFSFLGFTACKYINLGPAYGIQLDGTKDWTLLRTYSKDPFFVEGFELINDNTLLQSAGLYTGS
jgi:hypothetical protein